MEKFIYTIKGQVTYNQADNKDGFKTVEINETIKVDEMNPETALGKFLAENNHYEFYGSLRNCDAKTHGKKGATYRDQNENQTIEIDIIE